MRNRDKKSYILLAIVFAVFALVILPFTSNNRGPYSEYSSDRDLSVSPDEKQSVYEQDYFAMPGFEDDDSSEENEDGSEDESEEENKDQDIDNGSETKSNNTDNSSNTIKPNSPLFSLIGGNNVPNNNTASNSIQSKPNNSTSSNNSQSKPNNNTASNNNQSKPSNNTPPNNNSNPDNNNTVTPLPKAPNQNGEWGVSIKN